MNVRVAIVGAGMSGLCMAHRLREAGHDDVVIFEKADEVGGTWRENRYPGLSCDVPSRFYSYSFAPNPDWTHPFSPGSEIQEYFVGTSDRLGLRPLIRFGAEVTEASWENGRWKLRTAAGTEESADVLICATGVLHHPRMPKIDGLEDFAGVAVHSARWDPSLELAGKRVGIVGTGSTGVQITTAIAGAAEQLSVFQRTAQWILPVPNRAYLPLTRAAFRRLPWLNRFAHRAYQGLLEATFGVAVLREGWQRTAISTLVRLNLRFAVRDPALRRRLTPHYEPMCKRLVMSAAYYPALQRRGVEVVAEAIERVEPRGVITADGRAHELDVLILATGFDAHAYMRPMRITAPDGRTLEQAWADGPRAYRTVAVAGFPNLFLLMGPHSPIANQSLIAVAEAQAAYIVKWVGLLARGEVGAAVPRADATAEFNAAMREAASTTVFASGCASWYLDADGVPEVWPWSPARHRAMLREPELEHFAAPEVRR
ncbi:MAG: flavin-containing monooxygenase [Solirubrobacteraceae bacterium]